MPPRRTPAGATSCGLARCRKESRSSSWAVRKHAAETKLPCQPLAPRWRRSFLQHAQRLVDRDLTGSQSPQHVGAPLPLLATGRALDRRT